MSESRNRNRNDHRRSESPTADLRARPSPPPLARPPPTPAELAAEQLQMWADALVDRTNLAIRSAGLTKDGAADELFRETFGHDVMRGLDPEGDPTEKYRMIEERDGKSLRLDTGEWLIDYVRIGAMNQHRKDAAWRNLDWSYKVALVSLLGPEVKEEDGKRVRKLRMDLFKEGVAFANGPNVGTSHVTKFVHDHTPTNTTGRPRGLTVTIPRVGRFTETGVMLGEEEQRARFVARYRAAPAKVRRALLKDLRDTHANLGKLLDEMDDDDES